MSDEFDLVKSTRNPPVDGGSEGGVSAIPKTKIVDAVADNFPRVLESFDGIVNIARDIVEIEKIKVQSEAVLKKMAEDRKMLLAEAEAYVQKKNVDTQNIVDRMKMIQELLRDFYIYNQKSPSGLSGDDFTRIITELLSKTE
jgi:hypothetical protein